LKGSRGGPVVWECAMAAKIGGGGGSKFDLGQNSDMNVTPFVDVMLVLLIIFMVVAPLATVSIKLDLPPAKAPPPNDKDKPPTFISIQDNGLIYVSFGKTDIRPSSMEALAKDLAASLAVANPTNERIFIRADRHVRYRQFMDVINQLQRDGYYKIGLISENLTPA
jgi:biopolymer transport protein ExbD